MATRDCIETDYCFVEAIASIEPVADQIVIADSESTDGTREVLEEMAGRNKKIKVVDWKWTNPKGNGLFVVDWFNKAREHLETDINFQLESDEAVHEGSHQEIRDLLNLDGDWARRCTRYNFWINHRRLAPKGTVCADGVLRIGPQRMWMPSDSPHPKCMEIMKLEKKCTVEIFHYSFIRSRKAFFKKSRKMLDYFFGEYDPLLAELEGKPDVNWMDETSKLRFTKPAQIFGGVHPKVMWKWLLDRGYGP